MKNTNTEKLTCYGSVRGSCGHVHHTREAAAKCIRRDMDGCSRQGGHSDRYAYRVDDLAEIVRGSEHDRREWYVREGARPEVIVGRGGASDSAE